jgi:ribosomal protein S18 acetylase RimI-like enzyme
MPLVITIEIVGVDQWRTVRELRLAALQDAPDAFWATYEGEQSQQEDWWHRFIDRGTWFIAYEGEHPVGLAATIEDREAEESKLNLISMWVAPEARGRGVGPELIAAAKRSCRAQGFRELWLWVAQHNATALRLYESAGFKATGRTEPLDRKPSVIEHEMKVDL